MKGVILKGILPGIFIAVSSQSIISKAAQASMRWGK